MLGVLLAEFVWLTRGRGWTAPAALLRLGPGALMLLALRMALTDGAWPLIALPLLLSLPVHLADLRETDRRRVRTGF